MVDGTLSEYAKQFGRVQKPTRNEKWERDALAREKKKEKKQRKGQNLGALLTEALKGKK